MDDTIFTIGTKLITERKWIEHLHKVLKGNLTKTIFSYRPWGSGDICGWRICWTEAATGLKPILEKQKKNIYCNLHLPWERKRLLQSKRQHICPDINFIMIIKIIRYLPHMYYTYFIVSKQIFNPCVTIWLFIIFENCSVFHFGVMVMPASSNVLYFASHSSCLPRCSHNVAQCTGSWSIYYSLIYTFVLRIQLLLWFLNKSCK